MPDAPQLSRLLAELGYVATPAEVAERLSRLDADDDVALVAERDGIIVGLVTVHRTTFLQRVPDARITALVVASSEQRRGVGGQLVDASEAIARQWGCGRIEVTTGVHRPGAHRFYKHVGFTHNASRFVKALI